MGLYDFTFYDLMERNAVCFGGASAWFEADDESVVTFSEYREKSARLARGLFEAGIRKGDRIGALGENSFEFFLVYGAAAALGAIVLPINWRLSAPEAVYNLSDCRPKALFVDEKFQDLVKGASESLSFIDAYVNLKSDQGDFQKISTLMAGGEPDCLPEVSSDDGFVIIHTAAVAGRPRGALLSHGNVMSANLHLNDIFSFSHQDVHLNLLPLFHVGGLFMATQSFHAGALNVNMSRFDAARAAALIETQKATLMFEFPPILSSIMDESEKTGRDIGSLKSVMGLGAPGDIDRYQEMTGGTFFCMYGQTETSCLASAAPYSDRPGSAGRSIKLADITLVDDDDKPVAAGETGEITMKGPMVFKGYWNLPDDTAHAFRGGRHHTGDLGRFDEDGFLWYAGRKPEKELIKPGGENVYPAEVEVAILKHPAIEETVVFGVPDPKWKEGIKAVCRLKDGEALEPGDLIRFVGERIASFKKPQYVEFVGDMPRAKDGSIDRDRVKKLYGGDPS
jgi:acyl-CoA synthetase (AMP-forming)/AMP-acid ligase II